MHKFLSLFLCLLLCQQIHAQLIPAIFCEEAIAICNLSSDLDAYSATMPNPLDTMSNQLLCGDFDKEDNITWYSFIAGSERIEMSIDFFNCSEAECGVGPCWGSQVGVYSDCSYDACVFVQDACDGPPENGFYSQGSNTYSYNSTFSIDNLVYGEQYFLYIDGCSGSVCNYQMYILQSEDYLIDELDHITCISGCDPTRVQIDSTHTFEGVGPDGVTYDYPFRYTWEVQTPHFTNEVFVKEDDHKLVYTFDKVGNYTLCLTVDRECDNTKTQCLEISVGSWGISNSKHDFAPIGAEWKMRAFSNDSHQGYFTTCETSGCGGNYWQVKVNRKDTLLGRECSILTMYNGNHIDSLLVTGEEFAVYQEDRRVYFYAEGNGWNIAQDTFFLMLDFNLNIGDTLAYHCPVAPYASFISHGNGSFGPISSNIEDIYFTTISNVDTAYINGIGHKRVKYTDHISNNILGESIEGIGNIHGFFGDDLFQTDEFECYGQFYCYQDSSKIFSHLGEDCSTCIFPQETSSLSNVEISALQIYPNPASQEIHISTSTNIKISKISLANVFGEEIVRQEVSDNKLRSITLPDLPPGVYILTILFESGKSYSEKLSIY